MMEMFMKMFMEYDEKARIAQEERDEKRRIAQEERAEKARIVMLLDSRSIEQKPDQCRRMEPEPEQIRMTANAEDAASSINSEEVTAAVTKKGGNSDQPGMYLNDVAVGSIIMAESVCNSIPLEKEIGSGTIEMLSYEEDEPRDMDMGVEGVMANVSSENVRCGATHTFQELSTTDNNRAIQIELDVVGVSSRTLFLRKDLGRRCSQKKWITMMGRGWKT